MAAEMPPRPVRAQPLGPLREEITTIDRSIVRLLAARLDTAQRAIGVRVTRRKAVTDPVQERRVLRRVRRWAQEQGVPEALVDRLFRTLIEEGKVRFCAAAGGLGRDADPEAPPGRARPSLRHGQQAQPVGVPPLG